MRLRELTIYKQYFRYLIEDKKLVSVLYDNERQTVSCTCASNSDSCEHKVFIHEMMDREKDSVLASFLNDCREDSAQTITTETINRLRGAFAREYNIAKGVVQTPERRQPLGWQGDVPGSSNRMRVVQRTPATFMVYELGSDTWKLVSGITDPTCEGGKCRRGCKHEKAVKIAIRTWREQGLLQSGFSGKSADPVITDDFTMVERAEPVSRTGTITGSWLTLPPDFNGNYKITMPGLDTLARTAREQMEQAAREEVRRSLQNIMWNEPSNNTTASADITFDFAKFEEDMNKAKKLLEKKEKPKPEKPAKPRTRFTDLEL
ncbi:MAG: hypothetical protein J0M11_01400 [Anaerolineae bacterium]|nr:hypothetical protein [Anaerolineae bacterium]